MNKLIIVLMLISSSLLTKAQTKIIAHRGFSDIAPENTLIAFQKAIDYHADYFELDIHKTKDDSVMVIHDSSVDRTSSNGSKGRIAEMNYKDLSTVRVGNSKKFGDKYKDEKIPTLREALELAKDKIKVCIEIKVYGVENAVMEVVNDLEMNDQVIIFSFYYPVLAKIRQLDKKIPALYLISDADNTTIDYANVLNLNAIGVGGKTVITKEFLDFAHQRGVEVWKWTVDNEKDMQQLIDVGLDGLITNRPDIAIEKLRKMKR